MTIRPTSGRALIKVEPMHKALQEQTFLHIPENIDKKLRPNRELACWAEVVSTGPGAWRYSRRRKRYERLPVHSKPGDRVIVDVIMLNGAWTEVTDFMPADGNRYYMAEERQLLAAAE